MVPASHIMAGWTFPKIPPSVRKWIGAPASDDLLGRRILLDLADIPDPPHLLGYTLH